MGRYESKEVILSAWEDIDEQRRVLRNLSNILRSRVFVAAVESCADSEIANVSRMIESEDCEGLKKWTKEHVNNLDDMPISRLYSLAREYGLKNYHVWGRASLIRRIRNAKKQNRTKD